MIMPKFNDKQYMWIGDKLLELFAEVGDKHKIPDAQIIALLIGLGFGGILKSVNEITSPIDIEEIINAMRAEFHQSP